VPIAIRDDVVYIMLKKIQDSDRSPGLDTVTFSETDFTGIALAPADFLGHLDYLNQEHYINAEFSGNAYGNQDDVPNVINAEEVDFRIANTYGAPDGPLPHLIEFKKAELTKKGRQMLEDMEKNPPESMKKGATVPIATKDTPFLEKVKLKGGLSDLYDARDITEVVFRTMRDIMPNETVDRVASELQKEMEPTTEKALQNEIEDLWLDTNPLVRFISRVRQPLTIKDDTFLFRVKQEAGLQNTVDPETVVRAVFAATKDELSDDRVQELKGFLPGTIRRLWDEA